ncbi:phasin family protein [Methylobacterium oryzae CBMB20]
MLTQAFQDTSRIWLELSQKQWQRNLDGLNKLARAKSVQEYSAIQSELVREGLQSMVQDGKAITETSARAIEEASKTFSGIAQRAQRARAEAP